MAGGGGGGHGAAHGGAHEEEEHEEHVNHEAWVIPYADMLTLLMGLFLVLYGMSSLDLRKFQAMAAGLNQALAPGDNLVQPLDGTAIGDAPLILDDPQTGAGEGAGDGAGVEDVQVGPTREQQAEAALAREEQVAVARAEEAEAFTDVRQTISQRADQLGLGDSLAFRDDPRGLVVSILSDRVLFAPGSAAVQPEGAEILGLVAEAVRGVPNQLSVEGHTDNRPISTAAFPSNWELSTARATTVLQALVATGQIAPERISAAGYADQRPVGDNATSEGRDRNRRVELVILTQVPIATTVDLAAE